MPYYKSAYIGAILLAGIGGAAASLLYPANELFVIALSQLALAVLTFPLGFIAAAIGSVGIYAGLATPAECLFAMTPIYALLGYVQWWRLLPALYRSRA